MTSWKGLLTVCWGKILISSETPSRSSGWWNRAAGFKFIDARLSAERDAYLGWVKARPELDSLHSDPRYGEPLKRLHLSD